MSSAKNTNKKTKHNVWHKEPKKTKKKGPGKKGVCEKEMKILLKNAIKTCFRFLANKINRAASHIYPFSPTKNKAAEIKLKKKKKKQFVVSHNHSGYL